MTVSTIVKSIVSRSEQETIDAGAELASALRPGDLVACYGELGAGKTRFIKGACRGLGVTAHVTSPTFTIVNEYAGSGVAVFHFDFYRIEGVHELREIGFDEYLDRGGICLIEWPERVAPLLPADRFDVYVSPGESAAERMIRIERMNGGAI